MELDNRSYYPHPHSVGSSTGYDADQEIDGHLRNLYEKRQRLVINLQSNPYQQNEIESQLRAVDHDIQYYQQQRQMPYGHQTTAVTPTLIENPGLPNGYNKQQQQQQLQGGQFRSPGDSAIGSEIGTKAPSMVGDIDDLESLDELQPNGAVPTLPLGGQYPPYQQHYQEQQSRANEQVLQTSGDRVRMTMFPESSNEVEEVPNTQVMPDQQTNLQRMAQPAQVLRAAVQNIANYQSNTELTAQALQEIIPLLSHQDISIVLEASKLLLDLSKKEPSLLAIINYQQAVSAIMQTLVNISNGEVQKLLAGVVHNISNNRLQGLMMLSTCIPYLVRLLASQNDAVLFYAVTIIHNLLCHYEPSKMDVRLAGGLEKLVALLVKDNVKFLAIATDCLHILAYGHQDSKLIILASGGPALLVRIMKIYTYEKLLWIVSRLLKALSVCPSNKPEIVQAGGMLVLAGHLGHRSQRLVHNLLLTLRNLSDVATKQDNLGDLIRQLVTLLDASDPEIVTCCAGVLSNLSCNVNNKTILYQSQGILALLKAIRDAQGKEEIVERCVCTLRHVTSRNPCDNMARNAVRDLNGIPMLMGLLQPQTRWPLIKALIGLFRNLAVIAENHTVLREQGCIPKLWQLLNRAYQESQKRSPQPGVPNGVVDGVSMVAVVECSTAALHLLARDRYNRLILRQLNVIPMFVQLLYNRHDGIQKAAVAALSELVLDREGAEQAEREGASTPLTELLHSNNESIAAYAAAVLFVMTDDKNGDHQRQPSDLFRNDGIESYMQQSGHNFYSSTGSNPLLQQAAMRPAVYSNPGSVPGSQPFTPNMSEPPSGLMTPHSEFEMPLDLDDLSHPGSGLHSGHHSNIQSGIHTPNHPHSGLHTPNHPHSGIHTPNHPHSGVHTPHSGMHTPNHYHHHQQQMVPQQQQQQHPMSHFPSGGLPPAMGPGYHHIQQASYNPPSPALMETAGPPAWIDTDL